MHPSSLKTKTTTTRLAETRKFYITCLGMRVVEEWQEENDVGCILALEHGGREALLEIYEGPQPGDFSGLSLQFRTDDLAGRDPVSRPWSSTYLHLADPNGISVVVSEGGV